MKNADICRSAVEPTHDLLVDRERTYAKHAIDWDQISNHLDCKPIPAENSEMLPGTYNDL